ncbi:MAG: Rqc2 family fibronectin-binding protein [Christensenellales bacterium]|jgi:predicted ribosome quality control (RQC) complex YloA/Tae2 family protein
MPMDALTLGFVARELNQALAGARIDRVSQPERDEIILAARNAGKSASLLLSASADCARAHLTQVKKNNPLEPPMLCMLMRKHIVGGRIAFVRLAESDRILEIGIEHYDELGERAEKLIICEFMGRHSNLIFVGGDGRIIDSARRVSEQMSSVREVLPALRYERPPAHGKIPFDRVEEGALFAALSGMHGALKSAISKSISGLSAQTAAELAFRASGNEDARLDEIDVRAASAAIAQTLHEIEGEFAPAVLYAADGAPFDVVAFPYRSRAMFASRSFPTLSEAMDEYYAARDRIGRIRQKSSAIHRALKSNIERCERKLALQQEALMGASRMEEYRRTGDIIIASQHLIKKGMRTAELIDYAGENMPTVTVALDERLSPAQNAQRYYKKYQKARSARTLAAEQIARTGEELQYLEGQMQNLETCTDEPALFELRTELEKLGYIRANHNRRQMKQLPPSEPLRFTSPAGRAILVGKNNVQNDKLTFGAASGDMWLHAKDMPGSHVLIPGGEADDDTLHMAARLAAKYSKGGAGSHVPVDYTPRKYVKKPSGAKPGYVIYTHQRTLYVDPYTED